jgi:hypothetical protein
MCQPYVATPAFIVPIVYVSNGVEPTLGVKVAPVYPVGRLPPLPQACVVDISFTVLELTKPVPVSCTMHCTVIVQPVATNTRGPFNVKSPTSKEKSAFPAGLWLQHTRYRTPEVPAVISLPATAYTSYGVEPVTDVVAAKPVNVFTPAAVLPHDWPDAKMRIVFVAAKPNPVSCIEHVSVKVQSVSAVNGPEIWNDPMLNT